MKEMKIMVIGPNPVNVVKLCEKVHDISGKKVRVDSIGAHPILIIEDGVKEDVYNLCAHGVSVQPVSQEFFSSAS